MVGYYNLALGMRGDDFVCPIDSRIRKHEVEIHKHILNLADLDDAVGVVHGVVKGAGDLIAVSLKAYVFIVKGGGVFARPIVVAAYNREGHHAVYLAVRLHDLLVLGLGILFGYITEPYRKGNISRHGVIAYPLVHIYELVGIVVGHRLYITDNGKGVGKALGRGKVAYPVAAVSKVVCAASERGYALALACRGECGVCKREVIVIGCASCGIVLNLRCASRVAKEGNSEQLAAEIRVVSGGVISSEHKARRQREIGGDSRRHTLGKRTVKIALVSALGSIDRYCNTIL